MCFLKELIKDKTNAGNMSEVAITGKTYYMPYFLSVNCEYPETSS
jgi:hypothetical protein